MSASAEAQAALSGDAILEFWTPERMKEAKPREQKASHSSVRKSKTTQAVTAMVAGDLKIVPDDKLTTFPYQSVGKLFFRMGSKLWGGSAFVANVTPKNVIFTVAHNLYDTDGKAENILFIPAMIDIDDVLGLLYGRYLQIDGGEGVAWAVHPGWDPFNKNRAYDIGAVMLLPRLRDGKDVGDVVTPISIEADLSYNSSTSWNTIGYPVRCEEDPKGKMAEREGTFVKLIENVVYRDGGVLNGMSGGPWILGGSGNRANGIHSANDVLLDLGLSPYFTVESHLELLTTLGCH